MDDKEDEEGNKEKDENDEILVLQYETHSDQYLDNAPFSSSSRPI